MVKRLIQSVSDNKDKQGTYEITELPEELFLYCDSVESIGKELGENENGIYRTEKRN